MDLVVASCGTKEIIALRGRGNGMFLQPAKFSVSGAGSTDILARDFDGDGLPDVVTADYAEEGQQGGVSFFRGKGDGKFHPAVRIRTANFASSVAAGDMNGDGLLDLLVGTPTSVWVLLGSSRPYSRDSNHDGLPDECDPKTGCRVPGDIDEDVRLDISDAIGLLRYLFLGTPGRLPCGEGRPDEPGNLALLDWQGDGRIDLSDAVLILNFLYRGWAPHPLAVPGLEMTACVDIPGCKASGL